MLEVDGFLGLLMLGLWVFCIIDVITLDASRVRHLPKLAWLFIVLLLPDIGSIIWLVAGHPWEPRTTAPRTAAQQNFPEYDRPGRHIPANPDDDEQFLRQVRARAEEQRRRGEQERRERDAQPGD
jgi:hypothetical protein